MEKEESSDEKHLDSEEPKLPDRVEKIPKNFESPFLLLDEEILKLGIRSCDVESYRRKHYQLQFGINTWYSRLQQHTFRTSEIKLSFQEGETIVKLHLGQHDLKSLPAEEIKILEDLKNKIDEELQNYPMGAFIKLNTRSPKDTPVYNFEDEQIKKLIVEEIEKIPAEKRDDNLEVISFVKATNRALKVTSSDYAIKVINKFDLSFLSLFLIIIQKKKKLLIQSSRISEDLNKMLQFDEKFFDATLIFREWLDEVVESPEGVIDIYN